MSNLSYRQGAALTKPSIISPLSKEETMIKIPLNCPSNLLINGDFNCWQRGTGFSNVANQ